VSAIDLPHARRLAFGVVLGQAAVTAIAGLVAFAVAGELAALSALAGGGIATAGSLAMALLVFARAAGSAQRALGAFYVGEAVKLGVVGSEQLELERPRRAGEVVEDVLQDLHELDTNFGIPLFDARAKVGNHLQRRAVTARSVDQADHDVASIQLGGRGRPELGAEATREGPNLGRAL